MTLPETGIGGVLLIYSVATALGFLLFRIFWGFRLSPEERKPEKPAEDNLWQIFLSGLNPLLAAVLFPFFWPFVLLLHFFFRWLPEGVLEANSRENRETAVTSGKRAELERCAGRAGRAACDLRPAGLVNVDGRLFEAVSTGGFIAKGDPIKVTGKDGFRLQVAKGNDTAGIRHGFTQ